MKKRINLVQKGNKKLLCYTALVVLTKSQAEKLASESLIKRIDALSKDLNVDWAVEISGNYEIAAISRTTSAGAIEEEMLASLEKVAHEFMQAIDKMEMPLPEPALEQECPSHEDESKKEEETIEFVKTILKKAIPNERTRINMMEMVIPGLYVPAGSISRTLLGEMCELYLKAHEK